MLVSLAEKTGVDLSQLRSKALTGWVPWLFDTLPVGVQDAQLVFDAYVRDNSVPTMLTMGRLLPAGA
ncbi:hypothetical protein [Streptomyces sp. NPDC054794]